MIRHTFQIIMMLTMCSQIYAGDRVKARREAARLAALQPQQQEISSSHTLQLQERPVEQKVIQPTIQETASAATDAIFSPGKRNRDELEKSYTPLTEKKAKKRRELTALEAQVQEETARLEALRQQFNEESSKLSIAGTQAQQKYALEIAQTETAKQAAKRNRRESRRHSKAPDLSVVQILKGIPGLAESQQDLVANFIEQLCQTNRFQTELDSFIADIENARIQSPEKIKKDGAAILQKIAKIPDETIAAKPAYDFISGLMNAVKSAQNANVQDVLFELYGSIAEITNPGIKKASERYTKNALLEDIQKKIVATTEPYIKIKTQAESNPDLFPITYLLLISPSYFYPTEEQCSSRQKFFNDRLFPSLKHADKDTLNAILHHILGQYIEKSGSNPSSLNLVQSYQVEIEKQLKNIDKPIPTKQAGKNTEERKKILKKFPHDAIGTLITKDNPERKNLPYIQKLFTEGIMTQDAFKTNPQEEADLRKEELQKLGSKGAIRDRNIPNAASALELAADRELYLVDQETETASRRSKRRSSTSDIPTQRAASSANLTKIKTAIGGSLEINKDALKNALLQKLGNNASKA